MLPDDLAISIPGDVQRFCRSAVMADLVPSSSDSEYIPSDHDSDDASVSGESDMENDSDEELYEDIEPVMDSGWVFMADPFSDVRPQPLPAFASDEDASLLSLLSRLSVSAPFSSPKDSFL